MNSRRTFLRIGIGGVAVFFVFLWNKLTLQHLHTSAPKKHTFPLNSNKKVTFKGDFILVAGKETKVFSSHCTHLGCKIDKMKGDHLVCPCHGSEYDLSGQVVKGPAYKNLTELPARLSADGTSITIEA